MKLPSSAKARWNLLGTAILIVGLCSATGIWFAQGDADAGSPDDTGQLALLDSRKDVRQLEINSGQSGVVMEEIMEWLASLAHGGRLAATVAVGSLALGGGCFAVAAYFFPDWATDDLPAEPGQ